MRSCNFPIEVEDTNGLASFVRFEFISRYFLLHI